MVVRQAAAKTRAMTLSAQPTPRSAAQQGSRVEGLPVPLVAEEQRLAAIGDQHQGIVSNPHDISPFRGLKGERAARAGVATQ